MSDEPPYAATMPKPYLSDEVKKNPSRLTQTIGEHLLKNHRFVCLDEHSPIWMYKPTKGIWLDNGKSIIEGFCQEHLKHYGIYTVHRVNEIVTYIRQASYKESVKLGGPANKIVLLNGVFDLDTFEFMKEFCPDDYQIVGVPIVYNSSAECPHIKKFHSEILSDRQEDIDAVEELYGYCLYKDYPYAIVVFLVGEGGNGKTRLLDLFKAFLGEENVTGHTLLQLIEDKFARGNLRGKLANLFGDMPSTTLKDIGIIKTLTGGDWVTADEKFKDHFSFMNFAKLIVSVNVAPPIEEDTRAVWRRWRVIKFDRIFVDGEPGTISKEQLLPMLTTEEELSGLFNLAVRGLKRLREQGKLTGTKPPEEAKVAYTELSDPVSFMVDNGFFRRDPLELPMEQTIPYDCYVMVCEALKSKPKSRPVFGKKLHEFAPFVESIQVTVGGTKVWHYNYLTVDMGLLNAWLEKKGVKNVENVEPILKRSLENTRVKEEKPRSPRSASSEADGPPKPDVSAAFLPSTDPPIKNQSLDDIFEKGDPAPDPSPYPPDEKAGED